MTFLKFRHKYKITKFMLDSFKQNYIPEIPISYYNDFIKTYNSKECRDTNLVFSIGNFEHGAEYRFTKRKLNAIYKDEMECSADDSIEIIMSIDNVGDIVRIAVYVFLNKSLFAMKYHFPFISPEEINIMVELIKQKYNIDLPPENLREQCFRGINQVILKIENFVSLNYEFVHINPETTGIILNGMRQLESREENRINQTITDVLKKI